MTAVTHETISAAVGGLYDAAYGATGWPQAIAAITRLFNGSRGWLFGFGPGMVFGHTSIDDPEFYSPAASEALMRDPAFSITKAQTAGSAIRHSELYDIPAFRTRELWQDWMRPRDLYHGVQYHMLLIGDTHCFIDIDRARNQGDFNEDDKTLIHLIGRHLTRAGEVSATLADRAFGDGGLMSSPVAAMIVDNSLRVIDMNAKVVDLIALDNCAVDIVDGKLQCRGRSTLASLRKLVDDCISAPLASAGGVALLECEDGGRSARLVASVAPLQRPEPFDFPGMPLAVILLRQAHASGGSALEEALMQLFRLPPAHARLACALTSGITLRQAGAERGLTYASARTYLEAILSRTGTGRQTELVGLLKTIESGLPKRG